MKATNFIKPLEYSITADGERWRQGDKIKGTLKIKNHSSDMIELAYLKLSLTVGNFKKIKAKDLKAWEPLSQVVLSDKLSISALEEKEFNWDFQLLEDCQITEKDKSIYLTYFTSEDLWPTGQLELVIDLKLIMLQFLEIFESFLRFKVAQTKFSKGVIEVKLNPPKSRELSHVESLVLRMKELNKELVVEYIFNVHAFEMVAGNMIAQKKVKQFIQNLNSKQYYTYGDSPNHEFIRTSIESVVAEVVPKIFQTK